MNKQELSEKTKSALVKIKEMKPQIEIICEKGFISKPYNVPREIFDAYNRVIFDLGNSIGWADRAALKINSTKLINDFEKAVEFYLLARQGLMTFMEEDVVDTLSDVFILESSFKKGVVSELVAAEVLTVVSILRLVRFHQAVSHYLDNELIEACEETYNAFIAAQAQLLAAQELLNRATLFRGSSSQKALSKISDKEKNALYEQEILSDKEKNALYEQEILRAKQYVAGKKQNYEQAYNWIIPEAEKRWSKEVQEQTKITRITEMSLSLISEYQKIFPKDRWGARLGVSNVDNVKDQIRPIARKIAPDALKGGRPKKSP